MKGKIPPLKPGQIAVAIDMTDEFKERAKKAALECAGIIQRATKGPAEAFVVLHFLQSALEQVAGGSFDGAITLGEEDLKDFQA